YLCLHRNQKAINIDLKTEKGKEAFFALVEKSDVVLDNFRPGVLDRLGIGYEVMKRVNPKIVSCSISSYGQTGPYRERPGFDSNVQAISGRMSLTWEKDRLPMRSPGIADLGAAMAAAYGIASALFARERTGMGEKIDISSMDVQISLLTNYAEEYLLSGKMREHEGEQDPHSPGFGTLRTKDGCIAIAARRQRFWEALCKVLGRADLITDPKFTTPNKRSTNGAEVWSILNEAFVTKTTDKWMEILVAGGVPCDPVNRVDRALNDPQVLHREMVITAEDRDGEKVKFTGNPIKMASVTDQVFTYPAEKGQHTEEVLTSILGYSREKISQLKAESII
ncbi:MAG: CoA transferase, partial [Chloroflexi bacterium]|nr:CoA transferase [Chloroflexota bacterium]